MSEKMIVISQKKFACIQRKLVRLMYNVLGETPWLKDHIQELEQLVEISRWTY